MIQFVQASTVILTSCGAEIAHGFISKLGLNSETQVMNSLIDAYEKNRFYGKGKKLLYADG